MSRRTTWTSKRSRHSKRCCCRFTAQRYSSRTTASLIRRLATRIVELDRGQLVSFPGNYDEYLVRKQQMLDVEARENANFDKFLAEEEVWIRQGIKARRTRNEGRVRRLESLREERRARVGLQGAVRLDVDTSARSGQIVADLDRVDFGYGEAMLVRESDDDDTARRSNRHHRTQRLRQKYAVTSDARTAHTAPAATFARARSSRPHTSISSARNSIRTRRFATTSCDGADSVTIGGRKKHVIGYLGDFLFPPERANSPVASLSGGERNRLLMAKLFTQPANLLVFDEPTNDLDAETLELLEELLGEFTGTLLLVSHDRSFIDNVVTSILAFEGDGVWGEYVGGYQDWLRQKRLRNAPKSAPQPTPQRAAPTKPAATKKRLSYKEQRELDSMPQAIDALEAQQNELQQRIASPEFYRQDKAQIADALAALERSQAALAAAYARWDQLDQRS